METDKATDNSEDNHIRNIDFSSIQGKRVLVSPTHEQFDLLKKQLESRIADSGGETIFDIGAGDGEDNGIDLDEYAASVATLQSLVATLDADCVELRQRPTGKGITGQYLIRKHVDRSDFMEIRYVSIAFYRLEIRLIYFTFLCSYSVAVVGNVDAGKSTLLGVLTHGELDNGRGHARQRLFRHKHEMETGRTSSVGNDILGFDSLGQVVNKPDHGTLDWVKICEKSSKVITFIDLAGHERYLKTTVFGMTGHAPDFGMLMVSTLIDSAAGRPQNFKIKNESIRFQMGANAGIVGMTKEHLGLALALSVPVFVVVTKIDMCPPNILQDNLKLLCKVLRSQGCRKVPVMVRTPDDVVLTATNFVSQRLCPIFQVSNVTGDNLQLLTMFLNLLTTRMIGLDRLPAEFQIDDTYSVPGVGTVVSGTCLQGLIRLNDTLLLGPDALGHFIPIAVKSIHRKRMNVAEVRGGQTASFALKKIKRSQIRKGMVLVSPELNPKACWEFEGEIVVLHHPTTISSRYQAMVHCGSIRQTASIQTMSKECLRTGDKARVRFRFIKHPEYIRPQQRMVFREGRTKAVGNVIEPIIGTVGKPNNMKPNKMHMRGGGGQQNRNSNVQHGDGSAPTGTAENSVASVSTNANADESSAMPMAEGVIDMGADKRDQYHHRSRTKRQN